MALSGVDVIGPAFERMKRQLFKPFRLGQWFRLAITGLLAGEMGSAGGCNFRLPFNLPSRPSQQFQVGDVFPGTTLAIAVAVGLLVLLGIILGIAFVYVNSRMRFVLFDSVIAGQCRIRDFWSRRGGPAFRYFVWQILFALAGILTIILLVGMPLAIAFALGWLSRPREHIIPLVLAGLVAGFVFLAAIVVLGIVQVLTKDFVVPQMAFEDITAAEGWRRLWLTMKREKGAYAGYVGMKIVLSLAAIVILGIVTFIVLLVLLIPVGGFGVVAVIMGRNAGITWNPVTIAIAIVVGALVLIVFLLIVALISVPAIVFFPAYSMHFFAERYPPLRAALYPPEPAADVPIA